MSLCAKFTLAKSWAACYRLSLLDEAPNSALGRMRRWSVILLLLLAGGGLAYFVGPWLRLSPGAPAASRAAVAIPVIVTDVRRADVPILLTGLGIVQALNSVLVKSRVDGQIMKIQFSEGQDVHAGDVLVEIDPRGPGKQAPGPGAAGKCAPRFEPLYPVGRERHGQHSAIGHGAGAGEAA